MIKKIVEESDFISKSQKKRESKDIQELAKKLCTIPEKSLNLMKLDDSTYESIQIAKKLSPSVTFKRQIQYISKCLKQHDLTILQKRIEQLENFESLQKHQLTKIDLWREKLIETNENVQIFINQFPNVDVQQLRQVIRNTRKEIEKKKTTKSFRQLYQIIKEVIIH